jgi:protein-S-isoprenylcysteine O-methyltransferase Ste14
MDKDNRLIARFAVRETIGVLFMAVALFWAAGRLDWWPAWGLVTLMAAWTLATGIVIVRHDPSLLAERLGPRQGAERWDTIIMSIYGVLQLAMLVVSGLDNRFSWSAAYLPMLQLAALIVVGSGHALVVWATGVNSYFSQIARIQQERQHQVVASGPYRFVRHPGYAGSILVALASPVALGSSWALLVGIASAVLMLVRTMLEDNMLLNGLEGYRQYAADHTYRLLPGIW